MLVDYKKYLERLENNKGQVFNKIQPTVNQKTAREESGQARRAAMEEEFLGGEQASIF